MHRVKNIGAITQTEFQGFSQFQVVVYAEVTLVEVFVIGTHHYVQLVTGLFPAQLHGIVRIVTSEEAPLRKVLVQVSTEVAGTFRIRLPVTQFQVQSGSCPLVIAVIGIGLETVGATVKVRSIHADSHLGIEIFRAVLSADVGSKPEVIQSVFLFIVVKCLVGLSLNISGQVKAAGLGFFGGASHADSGNNSCDDARFLNRHFELLWAKPCLNDGINLDCHCKN